MPAALRSWLRARNPAQPVFVGLYTVAGITLIQFVARMLFMHRPFPGELGLSALLLTVPMLPIVGYHITQARRLFRAGYSLVDLRSAIGHNDAERRDAFALEVTAPLAWWQRYLQVASYGSIGQSLFGTAVVASGVAHLPSRMIAFSYLGSLVALGLSNAFGVPLLPASLRHGPRSLRDRLWTSRLGGWLARRMHAPTARASIGSTAFQPTEIALGCAAGDLFAGLPTSYRAQLAELPMLVKKLESRAVAARMQLDALGVAAPQVQATSSPRLQGKEETLARRALAEAVGALESIRLDLLRLHADGSSLAPITTLLDAARSIGADLERLIVAQRDVVIESRKRPQGLGFDRTPTPA